MDIKSLTPEQIEKAKSCVSAEELVAFAEQEGIELSEEQLDALSGGACWDSEPTTYHYTVVCSFCGKENNWPTTEPDRKYCVYCAHKLYY